MSALNSYYDILETLKDKLLSISETKTVTAGDLSKVDIRKKTIFPLSHIVVNSIVQNDVVLIYNVSVLCMDIVHTYKTPETDILRGNDNEQDVINTQAFVLNKLIQIMRAGDLYRDKYQIDGGVTIEFFADRFENNLAGAEATFDIIIPNDVTICD
jgi:hypothetical protein